MAVQYTLVIGVILIALVSLSVYQIGKAKSKNLVKYIPAKVSVAGIFFFYIKLQFISQGFEGIYDILIIIFLAISFFASILVAIILEIFNKEKMS
ncbi:hypothetical protein [Alkalihalobacterium elongatum]|uniref:hypothetical protein n=1 Tax=Alkalihalobacterium elongatum TaxID=2675466 RepID=UPI001C1F7793|nr:hypothetical protein [Alkalihalobacterium elongatum]